MTNNYQFDRDTLSYSERMDKEMKLLESGDYLIVRDYMAGVIALAAELLEVPASDRDRFKNQALEFLGPSILAYKERYLDTGQEPPFLFSTYFLAAAGLTNDFEQEGSQS